MRLKPQFWNTTFFRLVIGTAVSIFFLYLAVRDVPLLQVAMALASANYLWIAGGAVLIVLQSWVRTIRWILLFHPLHKGLHVSRMFGIVLVAQMLNVVMPWRVGDLARIYLAGEMEQRSKAQTLATLGIEKIFDSLMLLLIILAIPFFMTLPIELERPREGFILLTIVLIAAAALLMLAGNRILRLLRRVPLERFQQLLDRHGALALGTLDVFKRGDLHLRLQMLSLVSCLIGVIINYFVLLSLNLEISLIAPFLLFVVLQIGGSLPSAPGKLGVFQYLCVLALTLFGVDSSVALAYGVLLYAVALGVPVLLGILVLWWGGINLRGVMAARVEAAG